MVTGLNWLVENPIAHRGFHDSSNNIYENSLSACLRAVTKGFSIEVDLHPARDGTPMVFHDLDLKRLSGDQRRVRDLSVEQLSQIHLGNSKDHIPTLTELLDMVDGKVGLVLELKGVNNEDDGFVKSVAETLKSYHGDAAIMSFDHWLLRDARQFAPELTLGLVAEGGSDQFDLHRSIVDECAVDFISYDQEQLPNKFCDQFRASGKPLICWTVKSFERMLELADHVDQITFEQFDPHKA